MSFTFPKKLSQGSQSEGPHPGPAPTLPQQQLTKSKVLGRGLTQTAVDVRPAVLEHRQVLAQLS